MCFKYVHELSLAGNSALRALTDPMVLKWSSDGSQWSNWDPISAQCCPDPKNYPVPEWPKKTNQDRQNNPRY